MLQRLAFALVKSLWQFPQTLSIGAVSSAMHRKDHVGTENSGQNVMVIQSTASKAIQQSKETDTCKARFATDLSEGEEELPFPREGSY